MFCKFCKDEVTDKKRRSYCSDRCSELGKREYQKGRKFNYEQVKKWRLLVKRKAIDYKGGKCQICGYDKCVRSLDFHHVDPTKKDFAISEFKNRKIEKLKDELDKCILLCSNCHGGIMGALQEIKKNIDRNPDDIKKMKADQDAKSSAEFKETMSDIGYGALLLTIITALTVMVYRKWKKNEELVDDIESRLEIAEKINKYYILRNSAKNSGVDELDELFNKFKKIVDDNVLSVKKSSEPVSKPKFYEFGKQDKFIQEQELRAQTLEDIYGDITKVYKIWRDKKERLDNVKSVISGLSIVGILSSIEDGYRAWTELSNIYGVNTGYDKELLKSKASELSGLVSKAENAYKTSIADAENILSKYGPKEKGISREVSNIRSILSQYQTTDRQLKNWKSILDQSIASMMVYKNWAESGEDKVAQNAVAKFTNIIKNGYDKKNMDPMAAELRKALDSIESVQDKWRGRKEEEDEIERKRQEEIERKKRKKREEEEAERRRKRREEEEEEDRRRSSYSSSSSSYSSSSSDSGSSFGGFGGGDSGGGGSGGSW